MNSEISITVLATGFSLGVTDLVGLSNEEPEAQYDSLTPATRQNPPRAVPPSKQQGSGGVPGFLRRCGHSRCAMIIFFLLDSHVPLADVTKY